MIIYNNQHNWFRIWFCEFLVESKIQVRSGNVLEQVVLEDEVNWFHKLWRPNNTEQDEQQREGRMDDLLKTNYFLVEVNNFRNLSCLV